MEKDQGLQVKNQSVKVQRTHPLKVQFHGQFNWQLEEFDENQVKEKINGIMAIFNKDQNDKHSDISIRIEDAKVQGSGMNKHVIFLLKVKDKTGDYELNRRFGDFDRVHEKLVLRWPGYYIPSMPNKSVANSQDQSVIKIRVRFLNHFLKKVSEVEALYYGEQFQCFLSSQQGNVQKNLDKFEEFKTHQLFQRYQKLHSELIELEVSQEQIKSVFQMESQLRNSKMTLNNYKLSLRKAIESRDKDNLAQKRFWTKMLPEYEDICLNWWHGQTEDVKEPQQTKRKNFSSAQAQELIEDIKEVWQDNPFWIYYDIIKFQIREMDALLTIIQFCKKIRTEKKYLERTIDINKEQVQSLNEKKTTLKTLLMGGTEEQKRSHLANQSQECQKKLTEVTQLFNIVLNLMKKSLETFNKERGQFYLHSMASVSNKQLSFMSKLVQFYLKFPFKSE